jgi:hypothetical protein
MQAFGSSSQPADFLLEVSAESFAYTLGTIDAAVVYTVMKSLSLDQWFSTFV